MKNKLNITLCFLFSMILCLLLPSGSRAGSAINGCPKTEVTVSGILLLGEFFDPPNFGEEIKTDRIEHSYYLQLPTSVNTQIMQFTKFAEPQPSCSSEYFIQLVDLSPRKNRLNEKIGKKVKVVGTLFEAFTGHHHTHVLPEVKRTETVGSFRGRSENPYNK